MDEMEQLRVAAASLLQKAQEGTVPELASAVEKATGVLRLSSDIQKSQAELRKFELEESKLRHENDTASKRERSERLKEYVALMTPIVTIVTLAATLIWQSWQFVRSEKDKREAAEDAQWSDAVKVVSQTTKLSPAVIALNPFLKSTKYGDVAKDTAVQLLANSTDVGFYDGLFGAAFVPADWKNLDYLVKLDRALFTKGLPLYAKTWNEETQSNELQKLDSQEKEKYDYNASVMPKICGQIGSLLRQGRPNGLRAPDLSGTELFSCDLRGADFSGSNIEGSRLSDVNLKDANLDKISQFEGAEFIHSAWWEARKISPDLLAHLETNSKYVPSWTYGPNSETFKPEQYASALDRLKHQTP